MLLLAVLVTHFCQLMSRDVTYTAIENMVVFFLAGVTMGLRPLAQVAVQTATAVAYLPWRRTAVGQT